MNGRKPAFARPYIHRGHIHEARTSPVVNGAVQAAGTLVGIGRRLREDLLAAVGIVVVVLLLGSEMKARVARATGRLR